MADNDAAPADDLRSLLSGAFEESSATSAAGATETPAPKSEPVADASAADKGAAADADAGGDRPRGADGKFLKKDEGIDGDKIAAKADAKEAKTPKADDKPAADGADKAAAAAADKTAKDAEPKADVAKDREPPARWSASAKAMFKLQPAEVQTFMLDRMAEIEGDYTKKTQAIADLKKEYEPIQQLFAPHLDVLKQKGLTPSTVIRRWADVETALSSGRGIDIIDGIVKSYGIDKAQLAQRLGFTSSPSGQAVTDPPGGGTVDQTGGATDDQLLARLEANIAKSFAPKLAKIDAWETAQQTAIRDAAQQRETAVEHEISSFKSAVDEKGELKNPYYDEVEPAMIALAQSYVAAKQPLPKINELYDMAVWANPSTRQALLATQKAAQAAIATEEARTKSASARRAASSVTGAPGAGQTARSVRGDLSLREQLEEAAADNG